MISQRWFVIIPPSGAAREVTLQSITALSSIKKLTVKQFDCAVYQQAFVNLLKQPDLSLVTDLINQSLVISCLDFGATHCLVGALSPVTVFSLNLLRKTGIKTIHWFFEDYQRATYWHEIISGYDFFCAIQKGPLPEICRKNSSRFHFLPTAAHGGTQEIDINRNRTIDIAFIGIPSPYRIEILEMLHKSGFSLLVGGSGWKSYNGPLSSTIIDPNWINHEQMMRFLADSKIGINLSVENPKNRVDVHVSPRVYDIIAAGCILISEDVSLLHDSLTKCHFHTFKDKDDLKCICKSVINDYPEEKKSIASNRQIVLSDHCYINRVHELITLVT